MAVLPNSWVRIVVSISHDKHSLSPEEVTMPLGQPPPLRAAYGIDSPTPRREEHDLLYPWPCRTSQRSLQLTLTAACHYGSDVRPPPLQLLSDLPSWLLTNPTGQGGGKFPYHHQWFDCSYLCHILPLHGKMLFQDCLSYVLL